MSLARLDFPVELERLRDRTQREELREIFEDIDRAAEEFESAMMQLYFDGFLADRWVPGFLQ